jgi:hypothetical protein
VTTRLLLALVVGALAGPGAAQGLGGAAREEAQRRERQKAAGGEARAYSNEDLPSAAVDAARGETVVGEEAPAEVSETGSPPASADEAESLRKRLDRAAARRKAEERQWRARVAAARAAVEAARAEHEIVCQTGGFFVGGG